MQKKNIGGNFNKDYLVMLKNLWPTCVKKTNRIFLKNI